MDDTSLYPIIIKAMGYRLSQLEMQDGHNDITPGEAEEFTKLRAFFDEQGYEVMMDNDDGIHFIKTK